METKKIIKYVGIASVITLLALMFIPLGREFNNNYLTNEYYIQQEKGFHNNLHTYIGKYDCRYCYPMTFRLRTRLHDIHDIIEPNTDVVY